MRRIYTTQELLRLGMTEDGIRWAVKKGRLSRIVTGAYGEGRGRPSALERAVALVKATGGVACGCLAGTLLDVDGITLKGPDVAVAPGSSSSRQGVRRRVLPRERVIVVDGIPCTDGLQTLIDLADAVDDSVWEQALECVLRRRWATVEQVTEAARGSGAGAQRMRRVLSQRPRGAPPTESLLETRMLQLARRVPGLPPPVRQYEVRDRSGHVRARLDLAWPDLGMFVELDGQHHRDQPVADARRETEVVALTGWLCSRFTWDDVHRRPHTSIGRLAAMAAHARRRPAV